MITPITLHERNHLFRNLTGERGSLVVIVMVFASLLLVLGLSLYWLIAGQTRSTELERTDVKAFNVAEAGIDAGMLGLKLGWPDSSEDNATPTSTQIANLKTTLQTQNPGLWDPSRSDASQFLQVTVYDNVDSGGATTTVAYPDAPSWDSNSDGKMFVDASSNVDDDRHRIIILAERQQWPINLPGYACVSNVISSNGQGLYVGVEDGPLPALVGTTVDPQGKGIEPDDPALLQLNKGPTYGFDSIVTDALVAALLGIAKSQGFYYEGDSGASTAGDDLGNGAANGKVVYVKSTTGGILIDVGGMSQPGTVEEPVVLVIDTPPGSENTLKLHGTADFRGVVIVLGSATLTGTSGVHGAVYVGGTLENKGTGAAGEIYYNESIIWNINHMYVISVNIVPNTWEEYTLPQTATTVAGG
ncbi:MAG: hypothetical protein A2133_11910 [Actinobacteria bacterium RBG_16_64_13]|nr:MAG: hypothetical protein A2133_11910 [Actinobacteria bacterium RBG_16_64_13]